VLIEGLTRATKLQLDFGPAIGARLWMRAGLLGAGGSERCFYFSLGIISGGAGAMSYTDVVSHWFDRHRGLAPSVMMLGMELGAIVIPSVAQRLIATLGWRLSYTVFGLAILFLPLPVVAAFLKERPENVGLLPDGDAEAHASTTSALKSYQGRVCFSEFGHPEQDSRRRMRLHSSHE
jgi:MFS family permease